MDQGAQDVGKRRRRVTKMVGGGVSGVEEVKRIGDDMALIEKRQRVHCWRMPCWSKRPGKLPQCMHREVAEGISLKSSADRRVLRRHLGPQWRARSRKRRG
jgi:hypothetical protein